LNTYEFVVNARQLHLFYDLFESKQQVIDFLTEILNEGRDIKDVVYEDPTFMEVSYPECYSIEIEANDEELDMFKIEELSNEKINRKIEKLPSSYDSNGDYKKQKFVGYLIFTEYLKMRMTSEFETKEDYNREKITATITNFQCEIGEKETKDFEVINFEYDGDDIFVESDSGDGWFDIEFVYFSDEKGKVILDTDDDLENIISQLEKL